MSLSILWISLGILAIILIISLIFIPTKHSINIQVGQRAPNFTLSDETGKLRSLSEFAGTKVVVYFYPKDETTGCTKQACSLRDNYSIFAENGIIIIGISYDTIQSHKKFKDNQHLPFILLADTKKEVAKLYGAERWCVFFSCPFPQRITFLINEQGTIVKIMKNVDVSTHTDDILKFWHIKTK